MACSPGAAVLLPTGRCGALPWLPAPRSAAPTAIAGAQQLPAPVSHAPSLPHPCATPRPAPPAAGAPHAAGRRPAAGLLRAAQHLGTTPGHAAESHRPRNQVRACSCPLLHAAERHRPRKQVLAQLPWPDAFRCACHSAAPRACCCCPLAGHAPRHLCGRPPAVTPRQPLARAPPRSAHNTLPAACRRARRSQPRCWNDGSGCVKLVVGRFRESTSLLPPASAATLASDSIVAPAAAVTARSATPAAPAGGEGSWQAAVDAAPTAAASMEGDPISFVTQELQAARPADWLVQVGAKFTANFLVLQGRACGVVLLAPRRAACLACSAATQGRGSPCFALARGMAASPHTPWDVGGERRSLQPWTKTDRLEHPQPAQARPSSSPPPHQAATPP
jgi:hypothetical protein